jgi:hypothetical protein
LVYEELRILAAQKLFHESPGQTLQATALVHEAYIRLVGDDVQGWNSRGHFFSAAAEAMRRILVDNARRKKSLKRCADPQSVDPGQSPMADDVAPVEQMLALDEALEKLARHDRTKAKSVKLRHSRGPDGPAGRGSGCGVAEGVRRRCRTIIDDDVCTGYIPVALCVKVYRSVTVLVCQRLTCPILCNVRVYLH